MKTTTPPQWHPATELPTDKRDVLVVVNPSPLLPYYARCMVGFYRHKPSFFRASDGSTQICGHVGWHVWEDTAIFSHDITHWMDLPPMPKV